MKKTFLAITVATTAAITSHADVNFTYDNAENATGLHVKMTGTTKNGIEWTASDVTANDVPFLAEHFADKTVMSQFGTGLPREDHATVTRLGGWMKRFTDGNPHGGMTLFDVNENQIGHVVAGGGEGAGVSETAYTLTPENWCKGIMSSVVGTIVNEWAPEVRRIGLSGQLTQESTVNKAIQKAFCCFDGEALKQIDATASPANAGSWKVLEKQGFGAAITNVQTIEGDFTIDLDGKELDARGVENHLLRLYTNGGPLEAGKRYHMVGTDGSERTFSKNTHFDRMKYHYERAIETN